MPPYKHKTFAEKIEEVIPVVIDEIKQDSQIAELLGGQQTILHSHPGSGGGLTQQQIEGLI